MNEYNLIRKIAACFPRSPEQVNATFECDAEIVNIAGQLWGLTLDDFSPQEDIFTMEDTDRLGANLATATLSDLFAAGVQPRFFLHTLCLPRHASADLVRSLCGGIRRVLDGAGCALCGGDVGSADPWRYVGFAMGPVAGPAPLTHRIPASPQVLWVTGALGDANVAAFLGQPTPGFELRAQEAALLRRHATAAIDTSGGLADALWLLHSQSPGVRLDVNLPAVPLASGVRTRCEERGLPVEAAFFGGAGEYELLFTTAENVGAETREQFRLAGITEIGAVRPAADAGVWFTAAARSFRMDQPPPCPRSAGGPEEHARQVIGVVKQLLSGGEPS